ncbi:MULTISPECIES: TetR/AcrR family transcriptional regulator [Gordonia]|uniref:Putative TetR family transcriptional regulator n=1 Tax=Gordonia sihwensis NBRC 108236 TaxID=1223544 RepID=L7LLD4_9ACTN|nr:MULTISPECIES: TetR/AcrR family transcriptional regulator [Gordonia]AUH69193.1 TetR/AcrR family transcriptional regulator [Gordonia sp. YC-JH1]MBY4569708.1 TetR family transcriptional regulator [Gordonia sihwensis]GAC60907.1 putative TetR family transcriptional regulator [Gordonia sihwensis NBRC 108236]
MNDESIPSRSELTRRRLLDAALEAFAERGFHGTTTRDIASAAGMSPAAVYVHYRSKEDLLFELSHTGHQATLATVEQADDPGADPAERLASVIRAFAEWHARGHTSARIVNYELTSLTPEHRREIVELRREITRRVRAIVDAGIASGAFDVDDPHTTTNSLLSMGIDIARWYSESGPLDPSRLGDFYAGIALRVVGAAPVRADRPDP